MKLNRFKPKEVEIKSNDEKEKKITLKIVPDNNSAIQLDLENVVQLNLQSSDGADSSFKQQMGVFHVINDLFQKPEVSLFQLSQAILEILCKTLDAESALLWITEENGKELSCKVAVGQNKDAVLNKKIPLGKGIVGWVAENQRSSLILDASKDDRIVDEYDLVKELKAQSFIAAPLAHAGDVLGVIEIVNKNSHQEFSVSDKYFSEFICTQTAMHIKSERMGRQYHDALKKIQTIRDLQDNFGSTMELDPLLKVVLSSCINLLKAEVGSLWLLENSGEGFECKVAEGPTRDKVIGLKIKRGVGIVGWVVENEEPLIIEDCSKDHRFSRSVDKKIGFVTESMITVPLLVKGECIGAIQIINKKNGSLFNPEDLDLLILLASSSAMYIKNARLFASEKKAKELSALIEISKEITSTLDVDSVLMSIVNLSSHIVEYDSAGVSLEKRGQDGKYELKSLSGVEKIDHQLPENNKLALIHNLLSKVEGATTISDQETYRNLEGKIPELVEYMQLKSLESFWAYPLKDDQGTLGIISMESKNKNLIQENKAEILSILTAQSTVALRNAALYNTIPQSNIVGHYKEKIMMTIQNFRDIPKIKLQKAGAAVLATTLFLIFVKIPYSVSTNIEVLPVGQAYYASGSSKIMKIHVKPGQVVHQGQLLVELDTADLEIEKQNKSAQREKITSEMYKAKSEDLVADYKIKEKEKESLDLEIKLLDEKIQRSFIKAQKPGVIITEGLDELLGKPVNFGQEVIKVATKDQVYVQFQVPENEVGLVQPGQEIKFKVFGQPGNSHTDLKLESLAGEGRGLTENDTNKFFMANAKVSVNEKAQSGLRPGMTGRGKIYTDWQSIGYIIFHKLYRFLMLELFF